MMRLLFPLFFILIWSENNAQCYQSINSTPELPFNFTTVKPTDEEKEFINFFDIDIEYWQINNENRFCYAKNLDNNPKLILGKNTVNYIKDFYINKSSVYSNIIAYYFIEELNLDQAKTFEYYQNLPHLLAGYYYCYSNITKDWSLIESDVKQLKLRADNLNIFLENYVKFFKNYKNETLLEEFSEIEIKKAFLKGTYFAMPPNYRMHVNSDKIIGNDIGLLFKEATISISEEQNPKGLLKNTVNNQDLIFQIKKTKR